MSGNPGTEFTEYGIEGFEASWTASCSRSEFVNLGFLPLSSLDPYLSDSGSPVLPCQGVPIIPPWDGCRVIPFPMDLHLPKLASLYSSFAVPRARTRMQWLGRRA